VEIIREKVIHSWEKTEQERVFNCVEMVICGHSLTTSRNGTVEIKIEVIDITEQDGARINGYTPEQMLDEIRSASLSDIEFDDTCLSGATDTEKREAIFQIRITAA